MIPPEVLQTTRAVASAFGGLGLGYGLAYAAVAAPLAAGVTILGILAVATVACRFLPRAPDDPNWTPVWTPHQWAGRIFRKFKEGETHGLVEK